MHTDNFHDRGSRRLLADIAAAPDPTPTPACPCQIHSLSDSTLSNQLRVIDGNAREMPDATYLPMVWIGGEWADPPSSEPTWDTRAEAMQRSRVIAYSTLLARVAALEAELDEWKARALLVEVASEARAEARSTPQPPRGGGRRKRRVA